MTLVCGTVGTNPCKENRLHVDTLTENELNSRRESAAPQHRSHLPKLKSFPSALSEGVAQLPYEARARVTTIPTTLSESGQRVIAESANHLISLVGLVKHAFPSPKP